MSSNQYFSFSRIGLVMKRDLMENWKTNLYRFLGPYAGFLMVMIFGYKIAENGRVLENSKIVTDMPNFLFEGYIDKITAAFVLVLLIGGAYYASYIMETMSSQQKRISYLMLPATMLEKFVARALFVTVGFVITAVCALALAEATRYLFLPLFDLPDTFQQSTLPAIWEKITVIDALEYSGPGAMESRMIDYLADIAALLYLLWIHSFFILGGCYWHKHSFWKVLAAMLVFNIACVIGMVHIAEGIGAENAKAIAEWIETNMDWVTIDGILSFCIALLSILIMLNWWLSYKVFTRTQVIKPKFRLL
ncbi:MAG: hypothetical protein IJ456_10525 [Bacteroides sp.]|nr:hypothetical protein [Bacteroides sp.]